MKKKTAAKLHLSKETLHSLEEGSEKLREVAGGATLWTCGYPHQSCNICPPK